MANCNPSDPNTCPGANMPCDSTLQSCLKPSPPKKCVTSIKAKVAGTKGIRNTANQLPDNVLTSSSSSDESLATNKPVILVRGCKEVELEAVTTPANTPVSWSVKSNENTDSPPTITPFAGGTKAKLKTNVHGSFSVIAELDGCKVVWNVVFVWVRVLVDTSSIIKRDNKYADNGSSATRTRFRSGQFVAGEYPWEAKVKVRVLGGGKTKRLGTNKVKLHLLHNGVADTLTAHYSEPVSLITPVPLTISGTAMEVPKGGLPIRDSNDATDQWMDWPTKVTPDNTSYKRELWTGDSPVGSFPGNHKNQPTWRINSITGINGFEAAIASVSDDASNALMVHAKTAWSADYNGDVDAAGIYTPNGAKTTKETKFKLISDATGGMDAGEAGFETFPPRFNDGTDTTWTP